MRVEEMHAESELEAEDDAEEEIIVAMFNGSAEK